MKTRFNPRSPLIVIRARLFGPVGDVSFKLAIDTGSTWTLIDPDSLLAAGYDLARPAGRMTLATGKGLVNAPIVAGVTLATLGRRSVGVRVCAHALPPHAGVDGVLGLDFLRQGRLVIDFVAGTIDFD